MTASLISPDTALELTGIDGVDGTWVLDRFAHPRSGVTRVGLLLSRAKYGDVGPPARQLGLRLGEVMAERAWPVDLVVVAVPSSSDLVDELARLTGAVLGRGSERVLGVRFGLLGRLDGSVRGRLKVRRRFGVMGRRVPRFVLLVDDTVCTGETLSACARMLRARGAERVWAVATCAVADERAIATIG